MQNRYQLKKTVNFSTAICHNSAYYEKMSSQSQKCGNYITITENYIKTACVVPVFLEVYRKIIIKKKFHKIEILNYYSIIKSMLPKTR